MSDLRPKGTKIKLGNNEYGMRFTLNAIDEIQDHFNISIEDLTDLFQDGKKRIKALKFLLMTLINEDIDCLKDETGEAKDHITEAYVGRHIDASNMQDMMSQILKTFTASLPERDDDSPNSQSE